MQQLLLKKQSYMNILYLLVSFPLGLAYFVFLVTGISVGLGTLVIWVGPFILIYMMVGWRYIAAFERSLAIRWLHITIPPISSPPPSSLTYWQRIQAMAANSMTWKMFAYLLLKFPLGIISFVVTLVLLVLSLGLGIVGSVLGLLASPFYLLALALMRVPDAGRRLWRYLVFVVAGAMSISLWVLDMLAAFSGQLARLMLGMTDAALRLEEALARAERERIRAEEAEQRRRRLVVNVSHELRTPVASVAGHLESLLIATKEGTKTPPPRELYNYLDIAYQETRRLGMLVDELLSLARMESKELRLEMRSVVARDAVEEVYKVLGPLAQRDRQVTLVRGSESNLPPVLADYQRLVQILQNLVRNAITSTQAGGIVSINLEAADPQHLALIVADNGIGIAPEDLKHIFERFYRADQARSRSSGGFGLGLAIVHDLVTAMGGTISVESTPGQGTRFCVLLRIAPQAQYQVQRKPRSH